MMITVIISAKYIMQPHCTFYTNYGYRSILEVLSLWDIESVGWYKLLHDL